MVRDDWNHHMAWKEARNYPVKGRTVYNVWNYCAKRLGVSFNSNCEDRFFIQAQSVEWVDLALPHFLIFFLDSNAGFTSACHEPTHRVAVSRCKERFPHCHNIADSLHVGFISNFTTKFSNNYKKIITDAYILQFFKLLLSWDRFLRNRSTSCQHG